MNMTPDRERITIGNPAHPARLSLESGWCRFPPHVLRLRPVSAYRA
jgi:hypothetical protein